MKFVEALKFVKLSKGVKTIGIKLKASTKLFFGDQLRLIEVLAFELCDGMYSARGRQDYTM